MREIAMHIVCRGQRSEVTKLDILRDLNEKCGSTELRVRSVQAQIFNIYMHTVFPGSFKSIPGMRSWRMGTRCLAPG